MIVVHDRPPRWQPPAYGAEANKEIYPTIPRGKP